MSAAEVPQHLAALAKANEVRLESAQIRREVAALPTRQGFLRVAELLLDPPEAIQRTRVDRLLGSVQRVGPSRATKIARGIEVNPIRCVGPNVVKGISRAALSERQRLALATELRRMAS